MGQAKPPVTIAKSDQRGEIQGLQEILSNAGCVLEIIDEGSPSQALAGVGKNIGQLIGSAKQDPRRLRLMLGGTAAGIVVAIVLIGVLCSPEPELPGEQAAPVRTTTTATTTKQAVEQVEKPPPPKPTPFTNAVAKLELDAPTCAEGVEPFACLLQLFRELHPKLPPRPKPAPVVDAGPSLDASPVDAADAAAVPERPKALGEAPYLGVFEHRFVRCLAEEGSTAPMEEEDALIGDVIWGLRDALIYRHGRLNCTDDRTAMYDCMVEARSGTCEMLHGRLLGAYVELGHHGRVAEWRAQVANALGDKILVCIREERGEHANPVERAQVHVFRYRLAGALKPRGKGCSKAALVKCSTTTHARPCDEFGALITNDPKLLMSGLAETCTMLSGCE